MAQSPISFNILALQDDRAGNNNQIKALAEQLSARNPDNAKSDYQIFQVEYNHLAKLPNILYKIWPHNIISSSCLQQLSEINNNYNNIGNDIGNDIDIIISAGRKLAKAADYLKTNFFHNAKIYQIMRPELPDILFDKIILPKHDITPNSAAYQNISNSPKYQLTDGAIHNINRELLESKKSQWLKANTKLLPDGSYNHDKYYYCTVIIGGNNKYGKYNQNDAKILAEKLNKICAAQLEHQADHRADHRETLLLITTSGRTEDIFLNELLNHLTYRYYCYNYNQDKHIIENPYHAFLAMADKIILTSDSISMLSEALAVAQLNDKIELSIFKHNPTLSDKHHRFLEHISKHPQVSIF